MWALVWLISGVDELVGRKVALGDELLAAAFEGADEGALAGVCAQMSFQVTRFGEFLQTRRKRT